MRSAFVGCVIMMAAWSRVESRVALQTNNGGGNNPTADGECSRIGAVRSGDKCYWTVNNAQYLNALNECEETGGRIAVFDDESSLDSIAQDIAPMLGQGWQTIFWVGLRYNNNVWSWEFDDSAQDVGYNWKSGEKGHYQWDETCAAMTLRGSQNEMTWSSYHCTWNHAALCESVESSLFCDAVTCSAHAHCVEEASSGQCECDAGYTSIQSNAGLQCSKNDEGNGDPHFIVTSHDQDHTKLCYDVNGNDGDVLLIIRDEETKLEVNGEIYEAKNMKHPKAYFNNIAIFYDDVKVIASRQNITVNGKEVFSWTDSFTASLNNDADASISSGRSPRVAVHLSSNIHIEITRTKNKENDYFLGIMATQTDGLSKDAKGVMGNFLKSTFHAVSTPDNDSFVEFLDRSLTIPVQKVKRYSRVSQGQVDCWHYTVNTREMQDDLLGDRESYTVPTLNYKPF